MFVVSSDQTLGSFPPPLETGSGSDVPGKGLSLKRSLSREMETFPNENLSLPGRAHVNIYTIM